MTRKLTYKGIKFIYEMDEVGLNLACINFKYLDQLIEDNKGLKSIKVEDIYKI